MKIKTSLTSLLLLLGFWLPVFANTISQSQLNSEMAQALQNYVKEENVSRALVAVALPTQKTFVFSNSKANFKKIYFPIASISKTFTAALIVNLSDQSKLKLTDTIGQYFPQYPNWGHVSIEMLLNQTSGLPDYINTPNFFIKMAQNPNHLYSADELLNLAYQMPFAFSAGQGWGYSNTNYLLLGLIAEKVSGQNLADLYSQELFNPLKLRHTLYSNAYYPKSIQQQMMPGYFEQYYATPNNMTWGQGAAGIVSTPEDLINWAKDIYMGSLPHYLQRISNDSVSIESGASYSFGVFSINTPYGMMMYTPGLASGYRNILAYFPCQGIIITGSTNNGNTPMSANAKLLTVVMQTLLNNTVVKDDITQYQASQTLPAYCSQPKPKQINLPAL